MNIVHADLIIVLGQHFKSLITLPCSYRIFFNMLIFQSLRVMTLELELYKHNF